MVIKKIFFLSVLFLSVLCISIASAWEFNGTIKDINGTTLGNTLINVTMWTMSGGPPQIIGSNSTFSNASGWFNLSVADNQTWMYKITIIHTNSTTNAVDWIGQSLPQFPYQEFQNGMSVDFYLRPAGTINITAINGSGDRINFRYQVKDTKLGYPIAEEFNNPVSEAIIYVPRDRNYSIMIYPEQALPVALNWNNFSSESYNTSLLTYNATTHTLEKTFNCTDKLIRITGYLKNSTGSSLENLDEFTVVSFLLEPGNMIYVGENGGMPYNMSAWSGSSDIYNLTSGFYNITLPGPVESANYILFATARKGTNYYGGYRNLSLNYSSNSTEINFTMFPLMSTDWGSAKSNISLNDAASQNKVNISTAKQRFNLINSTNHILDQTHAHIEVKVDYTNYNATEFTFMLDVSPSSGSGSFYLPLLNASVEEINIFSPNYAPRRIGKKTAAQILANPNITMSKFNPRDLQGQVSKSDILVGFYASNETCDVPNPPDGCKIGEIGSNAFNPLSAVIGGGKLSFRIDYNNITIHYVNVDMLASGPPDGEFENKAGSSNSSSSFENAMKFGSMGPKIYDYVLVSMPYIEGSSSQTGLNESADVNVSVPLLYELDDSGNWNLIWNASANGTSGSALAENYSHYSEHYSEWEVLMNQNNCTRNASELNATNPCYIDTENNRIWIRLPHFSGVESSITGLLITASDSSDDTSDDTSSSSSTSGTTTPSFWTRTYVYDNKEFSEQEPLTKELARRHRIRIKINGTSHYIGVVNITSTSAVINVSSTPQQATLLIGDEKKFDVTDDNYYDILVKLNNITNNKANLTISPIHEEIPQQTTEEQQQEQQQQEQGEEETTPQEEETTEKSSRLWIWIIVLVIVVIVGIVVFYGLSKKKKF